MDYAKDIDPRLPQITDCLYRVSMKAIIIHDGKLLMTKESEGWHSLPGGGLDYGEVISDALAREIAEEISVPAKAIRIDPTPVFITNHELYWGVPRFQVYFRATLLEPEHLRPNELEYHWATSGDLDTLYLSPATAEAKEFLVQELCAPSGTTS